MLDQEVIGMEKQAAIALLESNGADWRIRTEDGQAFIGTCDHKPFRINLHIANGKIIGTSRG
jgi:uncharacterized protein YegP (UPF0339 family)